MLNDDVIAQIGQHISRVDTQLHKCCYGILLFVVYGKRVFLQKIRTVILITGSRADNLYDDAVANS